jgi:CRP/FNR family transcriptional regulator, cyclic AMP receptor protein
MGYPNGRYAGVRSNAPDPAVLAETPLYRGLLAGDLSELAALMREKSLPAAARAITAEEPGETIYVILSGSAKVHVEQPEGTEVIPAVLGPGELVGEMSLADSLGRSADVTTLEESTFLWMHRTTFRSDVAESTILAGNLAEILSKRLRLTNANLLSMATLKVSRRVASQLLALANEYGQ